MSDTSEAPWSNHSNAPQIPFELYIAEKEHFAGCLIGMITYGIAMALFFRCMNALLGPANAIKGGIRWALVAYTVALFSFLTMPILIDMCYLSLEYVDNREFAVCEEYDPGPLGYDELLNTKPAATLHDVTFPMNQWLADGLLLYRCYVIYSLNHWVMIFPCLLYLATFVLGIITVHVESGKGILTASEIKINTSYLSICFLLNVVLALLIVTRLIVHLRNARKATSASDGSGGLRITTAAVVTILIESYSIYAVTLLLCLVPSAVHSSVVGLFSGLISTVQVIAPYLIILRVAKRIAMTSESTSGDTGSMHSKSQWSMDGDGSLLDEDPVNSMGVCDEAARDVAGEENVIEEVPL